MNLRCFHYRASFGLILGSATLTNAATLHVPADHSTIQACIDAAVDGEDECVVAPGTYREVIDFLGKGVTLRSSDGPEATTIDATDIGGSVVSCVNYEGPGTVLRGFTITGGTGTRYGVGRAGGGMINVSSTPTVINCSFRRNGAEFGAGIYNYLWANPTIIDCTFSHNTAQVGGGIYNWTSSPRLQDSTFQANSAGRGGAIACQFGSLPIVERSLFRGNGASRGGALYGDSDSRATLTDCIFEHNVAVTDGAVSALYRSEPRLLRATFTGNTADESGGAVHLEEPTDFSAIDCTFVDNHSQVEGGGVFVGRPRGLGMHSFSGSFFSGNSAARGGGLYFEKSSRIGLQTCDFESNQAQIGGAAYFEGDHDVDFADCAFESNRAESGAGGGVFFDSDVSADFSRCNFRSNHAADGGGFYLSAGKLDLADCTFSSNTAEDVGGALFTMSREDSYRRGASIARSEFVDNRAGRGGAVCEYNGEFSMKQCCFVDNVAKEAGALFVSYGPNEIIGCEFTTNTADLGGGAIFSANGATLFAGCEFRGNEGYLGGAIRASAPLHVTGCLFERNVAALGGAVFTESEDPSTIEHSIFQGNRAPVMGGAITLGSWADVFLGNCVFSGNTSEWGGAIHNDSRGLLADHCTFVDNFGGLFGGAITNDFNAGADISHSVFWNDDIPEIYEEVGSQLTLGHSDMRGSLPSGAVDEGGNFDFDPSFVRAPDPGPDGQWDGVDDDFGDLRLLPESPCIDAGDASFVPTQGETDLDGHARVLCGRVDIGAYESGIGDYNCDRTADLSDFAAWQGCMTGPGTAATAVAPCDAFDFDADGAVDLLDLRSYLNLLSES